ncbi:conserved hypothetical protein [Candidatus Protochlamydia naegleriophila]|uniref:YbaK/aminoacyl-tRNA synthetase-associated domain-containing protein n=1 Tax=Candidatus Protochlamydia naegleriophila TaxID=389348 RepID=A0A0U5K218_9BACT|nr:YbaK/EbsC family protein [Candidatus Protochlamydia naegleriophila]CUI16139.1 conserved hypothetical protein [Candidatus Protochlamydia naegleriophila]
MSLVLNNIEKLLQQANIPYRLLEHTPTHTCEESASVRGDSLERGAKALVIKVGDQFYLFVLSAILQLDTKRIKKILHTKSLRFATKEELASMTQLVPGAVPPFGKPILPFDLWIDRSLLQQPRISFNAGSLTHSIQMDLNDYLKIAKGQVDSFSKASD